MVAAGLAMLVLAVAAIVMVLLTGGDTEPITSDTEQVDHEDHQAAGGRVLMC